MLPNSNGAIKITIPNMSDNIDEFRYKWKFTVVTTYTGEEVTPMDDITFYFESDSFSKIANKNGDMNYILSQNIFNDGNGSNVTWAFYPPDSSASTYYDSFLLMTAAFEAYFAAHGLDYALVQFSKIEIKFKTYANSIATRDWTDWVDITDEMKDISLKDTLVHQSYDGRKGLLFRYTDDDETPMDVYCVDEENDIEQTDINSGGVSILDLIKADISDNDLFLEEICIPFRYFYYVDDDAETTGEMFNELEMTCNVTYYSEDLTDEVFPIDAFYVFDSREATDPNSIIMEVYDYDTEFELNTNFEINLNLNNKCIVKSNATVVDTTS